MREARQRCRWNSSTESTGAWPTMVNPVVMPEPDVVLLRTAGREVIDVQAIDGDVILVDAGAGY